jgi:4-amino-4-deoxy-L-arabinose transferase-like glycosyltransferase
MLKKFGFAYLDYALLAENVERMAGGEGYVTPAVRPVWYYLKVLPGDLAPWSLVLSVAILWLAVRWKVLGDAKRELVRIAASWSLAVLLFFSLSGYKLPHYILPGFPALAILIGVFLSEATLSGERRAWTGWWLCAWIPTACLIMAASFLCAALIWHLDGASRWTAYLAPGSLCLSGIIGLSFLRRPVAAFCTFSAGVALAFGAIGGINVPRQIDPMRPVKSITGAVVTPYPEDALVVAFDLPKPSTVYYTDHRVVFINAPEELEAALKSQKDIYVFTRRSSLERLPAPLKTSLTVLEEKPEFHIRSSRLFKSKDPNQAEKILLAISRPTTD